MSQEGAARTMTSDPAPIGVLSAPEGDPPVSRRAAALRAAIVAALGAAIIPFAHLIAAPGVPLCAFKVLTGWPCPGCGMTRAMVCLCHGDAVQSFRFHPLGLLLGGTALAVLVSGAVGAVTGRDPVWRLLERRGSALAAAFVVALLATWAVRTFIVPGWAPDPIVPGLLASR